MEPRWHTRPSAGQRVVGFVRHHQVRAELADIGDGDARWSWSISYSIAALYWCVNWGRRSRSQARALVEAGFAPVRGPVQSAGR